MMTDLILAGAFVIASAFMYFISRKSMQLIDRLTDKVMSFANQQSFATYAATTPTAKDDSFRIPSPSNGNGNGRQHVVEDPYTNLPPHLEPIL